MTSKIALVAGAVLALSAVGTAHATLIVLGSVGGAPTGVILDNLDALTAGGSSPQTTATNIGVSFAGTAGVVEGSVSGLYAAPYISGSNGTGFGNAPGLDTSAYLVANPTSAVTLTLPGMEKYIGLLWGSVDTYNTLSLYDGTTLVASITGADVIASPNGNQGVNGTVYVNINSTVAFDKVVASSSGYAFEFDDIAFSPMTTVPEPLSLALLGVGIAGIGAIRRER